ncbi:MAG: hypothetical protein HYR72_25980 [Deltaproteobacteria bacterium]|nr:hypothetical protein [Deltaproteobacteria bacterium]MBI3391348.1 hypothetical protein [Deltaproteobacteria bacterium]
MSRKLVTLSAVGALATVVLVASAYAGEAKSKKYVWVPPVNVTQALNINLETKATKALLKKADEQCIDADCKKQVAACRKKLATCVIVPSKESVHEMQMEHN